MKGTIRVTAKVTWKAGNGERRWLQREKRFVPTTPKRVRNAWVEATKAQLRKRIPAATADRAAVLGTLAADATRYYPLIRHLADWVSRRSEVKAWFPFVGDRYRHTITREDVLKARGCWKADGLANRTINNRVTALRDLYRKLDGDSAPTPCDGVKPLPPVRTPITRVTATLVNQVLANLLARQGKVIEKGRFVGRPPAHCLEDRARLMVLASTGKRPCEVERAKPDDVNLEARVWAVRDAKGGWSEGMYLNNEMLIAWTELARLEAWGPFPGKFSHRLHLAGWPKDVRVYNVRHSTWITASERGAPLCDIQAGAGHRNMKTTREHYVPVLNSRMQRLSELLDGRFGWVAGEIEAVGSAHTVTIHENV